MIRKTQIRKQMTYFFNKQIVRKKKKEGGKYRTKNKTKKT